MGIVGLIVLGGVAGWLGTVIMGKDSSYGMLANVLLGIIGSIVGAYTFEFFGGAGVTGFNLYSLMVATVGAVMVLYIAKLVRG